MMDDHKFVAITPPFLPETLAVYTPEELKMFEKQGLTERDVFSWRREVREDRMETFIFAIIGTTIAGYVSGALTRSLPWLIFLTFGPMIAVAVIYSVLALRRHLHEKAKINALMEGHRKFIEAKVRVPDFMAKDVKLLSDTIRAFPPTQQDNFRATWEEVEASCSILEKLPEDKRERARIAKRCAAVAKAKEAEDSFVLAGKKEELAFIRAALEPQRRVGDEDMLYVKAYTEAMEEAGHRIQLSPALVGQSVEASKKPRMASPLVALRKFLAV